jgi:tRNA dimethylallyltransferase
VEVNLPLVVIVGPTASGKTILAIELAEQYGGEIICADSRTAYKGMDIGTAKPTAEEQARVPHWGLDLVEPGDRFSAADFKKYAEAKIEEIRARGRIPFLVGGTGLYVDGVLFDYQFGPRPDEVWRKELDSWTLSQLIDYCYKNNINLPENQDNKRYVIRAIEQGTVNHKRNDAPIDNSIIVGIATDRKVLRARIEHRAEQLFQDGVVEEAIRLGKKYGWDNEAMTGNIYPLVRRYLENELSFEEIKYKFTTLDWRLAKRQLTWLHRNPHIIWLSLEYAHGYISHALASEH